MRICLCLHNHQPVGNFQHVMEEAFQKCYLPMLEVLEEHDGIRTGLHVSGSLLQWLQENHGDYIERCAGLCSGGRMELLTSGRYEPVLTVFRRDDIVQQIEEYSGFLHGLTGSRPGGLWLTERVWEPGLPSLLKKAGVDWAVVDDIHLLRAGASEEDVFRPCVTEDSGDSIRLLASIRRLRYMIPFHPVESVIGELRKYHDAGAPLAFYGDDGEKFGVWPGTEGLCYGDRWLHRFFDAIEGSEWLETVLPSEAAHAVEPAGPFYVPASSYPEMGEWTVHGRDREEYDRAAGLLKSEGMEHAAMRFLSGGFWRNFLTFYPESKELQGRILGMEALVRGSGSTEALHHFWRSQCNCAFWHGVFGGIYLPHLREAVWKEIHMAELKALGSTGGFPMIENIDMNSDGSNETVVITPEYSATVDPSRGLTVSQLTFNHASGEPVPLMHLLSRRRESYHSSIPEPSADEGVQTIHGQMGSKEQGLSESVSLDRWRRVSFRDLIVPGDSSWMEWSQCSVDIRLLETAGGPNRTEREVDTIHFFGELRCGEHRAVKSLSLGLGHPWIDCSCRYSGVAGERVGLEVCLNLMTGRSEDRYFSIDGGPRMLMSSKGEYRGGSVEVVDAWRRVRTVMVLDSESFIWVTPLDSVNRSESGFEKVHQGTAFFFSRLAGDDGALAMGVELRMEATDAP